MKEQELIELSHKIDNVFEELVDEFELDYGDSCYSTLSNYGLYDAWIEAPNHTSLAIQIEIDTYGDADYYTKEEIKDILLDAILESKSITQKKDLNKFGTQNLKYLHFNFWKC